MSVNLEKLTFLEKSSKSLRDKSPKTKLAIKAGQEIKAIAGFFIYK
jgi:hypothetical protein